jgi:hypothetical protein
MIAPPDSAFVERIASIHVVEMPDAERVNTELARGFAKALLRPGIRRTHHFHGRFENTYIAREALPALGPVIDRLTAAARLVLGRDDLHYGFWFNQMQPGQRTSLHAHEELDELLSAVYYVSAPDDSGDLVLHDDPARIVIRPRPGLAVLFPPDVPHEVEPNLSDSTRLSIAFNFGPADAGR